jgi:SulP family sulfate permease
MNTTQLAKYLPILDWGRTYDRSTLTNDLVAALIVTIMLIPQSLAYALLAGLPPEMGLYASMLPIILYAIFGTSRALAVGPVAVVSLLTVAAVSKIAVPGTSEYIAAAITLAFLSGLILLALGVFRLGFLANFLSHSVIAGFITATGIIIAASQLKNILGIDANGHTLPDLIRSLAHNLSQVNWITAVIGVLATGFLFWVRKGLLPLLVGLGLAPRISRACRRDCGHNFDRLVFRPCREGCAGCGRCAQGLAASYHAILFDRHMVQSDRRGGLDLGHRIC